MTTKTKTTDSLPSWYLIAAKLLSVAHFVESERRWTIIIRIKHLLEINPKSRIDICNNKCLQHGFCPLSFLQTFQIVFARLWGAKSLPAEQIARQIFKKSHFRTNPFQIMRKISKKTCRTNASGAVAWPALVGARGAPSTRVARCFSLLILHQVVVARC